MAQSDTAVNYSIMSASKFSWILEDARIQYARRIKGAEFHERYLSPNSRFLPRDPAELREFLSSKEFREIQEMGFKLAVP